MADAEKRERRPKRSSSGSSRTNREIKTLRSSGSGLTESSLASFKTTLPASLETQTSIFCDVPITRIRWQNTNLYDLDGFLNHLCYVGELPKSLLSDCIESPELPQNVHWILAPALYAFIWSGPQFTILHSKMKLQDPFSALLERPPSSRSQSPKSRLNLTDLDSPTSASSLPSVLTTNRIKRTVSPTSSFESSTATIRQKGATFEKRKTLRKGLSINPDDKRIVALAKQSGMDKEYVRRCSDMLFASGPEISVEQFISNYEGKLGPATVLQRLFTLMNPNDAGKITDLSFLQTIAVLMGKKGWKEQLTLIFKAYDETDSGQLSLLGFNTFFDHFKAIASYEGKQDQVHPLMSKLDPEDEGVIFLPKFIEIGTESSLLIDVLLPPSVFEFSLFNKMLTGVIALSKETEQLFTLLKRADTLEKHQKRIDEIIASKKVDLSTLDVSGETFLHYAVAKNKKRSLVSLLDAGANPNQKYQAGYVALHAAVQRGLLGIVQILLQKGALVNVKDDTGFTALHGAMRVAKDNSGTGLTDVILEILNHGADVTLEDEFGCTAFDVAARYGQHEQFPVLVKHGADPNHISRNNYTPLHWIVAGGDATCIKKLQRVGQINFDAQTSAGATPLHSAAGRGSFNCVESLLQFGSNILALDTLGRTPLHYAAANGDVRCLKHLIKAGPEALKIQDKRGMTPSHVAKQAGHTEAHAVLETGPLQQQSEFSKLLLAHFKKGENDIVKSMLKKKDADPHAANENGTTMLHYAAMQGRADILELVLQKGANPNVGNSRNTTALHKAAQRGELRCLRILLDAGANINCQDEDDMTPLHRVLHDLAGTKEKGKATERMVECVSELITRKARINIKDGEGFFPLEIAAKGGLDDCVTLLVDAGADLLHRSNNGWSPLHWAAAHGHAKTCTYLATKLPDKDLLNGKQQLTSSSPILQKLPIHLAVAGGHLEAIQTLILLGSDLNRLNEESQTVLHIAVQAGHPHVIKFLIDTLPDECPLTRLDSKGNTPLHYARTEEAIDILVRNPRDDIRALNFNKENPIHVAASGGHSSAVQKWITKGLKGLELNADGRNAIELACKSGHLETASILNTIGCKIKAVSTDGIKFEERPGRIFPSVECGFMENLVEHACNPNFLDRKFVKALLLGFRVFVEPTKFFTMLMAHFKPPNPKYSFPQGRNPTEPGLISVMYFWLKYFPQEFCEIHALQKLFLSFLKKEELGEKLQRDFSVLWTEQSESQGQYFKQGLSSSGGLSGKAPPLAFFLNVDPKLIAEQLTLIEYGLFKSVTFKEFESQAWNKKDSEKKASNILAFIRNFNKVTNWVVSEIVRQEKKSTRVSVLKYFLKLAGACFQLRNFNTVMEIVSALESPPVSRLKSTWADIGKENRTFLNNLKEKFSPLSNYTNYRRVLDQASGNAILPFLGVQLQDLLNLDEGNPNLIGIEGQAPDTPLYVNFFKMQMQAIVVFPILRLQKLSFGLTANSDLVDSIINAYSLSENAAYAQSLKIEPRK